MSDETSGAAKPKAAPKPSAPAKVEESAVYVVQIEREVTVRESADQGRGALVWEDIATVSVPPKSHRKSAIGKALAEAGIKPEAGMAALKVRVLDVDSALVREVPVVVADPTFAI